VFLALGTQREIGMRHVVSCNSPALLYFSTLSHKPQDFPKKKIHVFWFFRRLLSDTFLILRRTEHDTIKITRYSRPILMELEFFRQIFEKKYPISMKIRPVGAEVFHADRHNENNSGFSQFCERA
jgi:hypothetical protein